MERWPFMHGNSPLAASLLPQKTDQFSNILSFPIPRERTLYGAAKRPNVPVLLASISLAMLIFFALLVGHASKINHRTPPLAVLAIQALPAPPPPPPSPPEQTKPLAAPEPVILPIAPPQPSSDTPPIAAHAMLHSPVALALPTPAAPPAPPAATITAPQPAPVTTASDLSSTMTFAPPPRYPQDSRRKREQGVVVLQLLLDENGRVAEISIARSSGHRRLDQAALSAVRQWRWAPTRRNGVALQVKGLVEIPFVLQERSSGA